MYEDDKLYLTSKIRVLTHQLLFQVWLTPPTIKSSQEEAPTALQGPSIADGAGVYPQQGAEDEAQQLAIPAGLHNPDLLAIWLTTTFPGK